MRELSSFDEVLQVLGGFEGASKLTGAGITAVSNWRARGEKFPARHFLVITDALSQRKKTCPRDLFTFKREAKAKRKAKQNGKRKAA